LLRKNLSALDEELDVMLKPDVVPQLSGPEKKNAQLCSAVRPSPYYRDLPGWLARFSYHDVVVIDEKLCRALA
jgi:hypothetical protein